MEVKRGLRKDRRKERGEAAKENEDRLDGGLPKDVLVDQRKVKFVKAEDSGQEKAEDEDEQIGEGINEFLVAK
jgi:hypothetical protein